MEALRGSSACVFVEICSCDMVDGLANCYSPKFEMAAPDLGILEFSIEGSNSVPLKYKLLRASATCLPLSYEMTTASFFCRSCAIGGPLSLTARWFGS